MTEKTSPLLVLVHRIRFSFVTDDIQATLLQEKTSRLFKESLFLDIKEVMLASAKQLKQYACVERVSLNLGDISFLMFDGTLRQRLRDELAKQLRLIIPLEEPPTMTEASLIRQNLSPFDAFTNDQNMLAVTGNSGGEDVFAAERRAGSLWQQFIRYLEQGHAEDEISAVLKSQSVAGWLQEQVVVAQAAKENMWRECHRALLRVCMQSVSLQRLIASVPESVLLQIADFLLNDERTPYVVQGRIDWHRLLPLAAVLGARLHPRFSLPEDTTLWPIVVQGAFSSSSGIEAEMLTVVREMSVVPTSLREALRHEEARHEKAAQNEAGLRDGRALKKARTIPEDDTRMEKMRDAHPRSDAKAVGRKKQHAEPETLPVSNAGISLLWLLLPKLFKSLNLLHENKFVDEAARVTAICYLDHLIWGDAAQRIAADGMPTDGELEDAKILSQEWRTPLNKILCGLPLDALIDPWTAPSPEEQVVMQQWLAKALRQIPVLHRLTVNDLRELFLQRPGQLVKADGRWTLQVEREAADMLLKAEDAGVPWPMNHLALPWLELPLEIEWF